MGTRTNQVSRSSQHSTDLYDNAKLSKITHVAGAWSDAPLSPDRFVEVFKPYAWRGLNNPAAAKLASETDLLAADREVSETWQLKKGAAA